MARRIEVDAPLTLEDVIPVDEAEVEMDLVPNSPQAGFVRMKPCVTASERDRIMEKATPGRIVVGEGDDQVEIITQSIANQRGTVPLSRFCWIEFVTAYEFTGKDGNTVSRGGDGRTISPDTKRRDFEDLMGRGNAVVQRFAEFCAVVHRIRGADDSRVAEELGNSSDGAKDESVA